MCSLVCVCVLCACVFSVLIIKILLFLFYFFLIFSPENQLGKSMSFSSSPMARVQEVVPLRRRVCIPGDAVLALDSQAAIGLGSGLYTIPYPDESDPLLMKAVVFTRYCAPLEKSSHHSLRNLPHYTVESPSYRRYMCHPGDPVIGIVVKKMSPHYFLLYIGGTALICMDALAFDGASKTNYPRLAEGAVVYGFIQQKKVGMKSRPNGHEEVNEGDTWKSEGSGCGADNLDIEMSCAASVIGLPHKDWTSSDAIFGPLSGGRVLTVPIPYARSLLEEIPSPFLSSSTSAVHRKNESKAQKNIPLHVPSRKREREEENDTKVDAKDDDNGDENDELSPASYLIYLLGKRVPFDICIGLNGMIWVKGQHSVVDPTAGIRRTMAVCACIMESQLDSTRTEMEERVEKYFPK